MLVARIRFYYPDLWRDPTYRTQDGIIPFPLFWLYAGTLGRMLAFERVQTARAVAHAIALSFGEKDGSLPDSVRGDMVDAYLLAPEA